MMTFMHILGAGLWLGVAISLPFWGNRMKRADNLSMVLGIGDTVFILKNVFIMGGLLITGITGYFLTVQNGLPFFDFSPSYQWLALSQTLYVLIALNSTALLVLMILGRSGRRFFYRFVPPIGYNNIALILLVYVQMIFRPDAGQQLFLFTLPLLILLSADILFISLRVRHMLRLRSMSPEEFANHYFGLLNSENMYELLRLFYDDASIEDPFATSTVEGMVAIEKFFQFLGDQFDDIKIYPQDVVGTKDDLTIKWKAQGKTKNGLAMESLVGTNTMHRESGRIKKMHIDFNLGDLPQLELYAPA